MERSVIRDQPVLRHDWPTIESLARQVPDYAEFTIGPAEGRTRWLHPGYGNLNRSAEIPH
jgi:hypothetical protein